MPNLPASTDFTGSGITEAQFKTAITDMREYLAGLLGATGAIPAAQAALDVIFGAGVTAKSGAYTVATTDRGQLFNCTGTWTLSLPSAATAGAGFAFAVRNSGSGTITIDPSGAELINEAGTFSLTPGAALVVVCTGTAWVVVGHPGELNYVKHDHGHNNVGSLCYAAVLDVPGNTAYASGSTHAGSSLRPACHRENSSVTPISSSGLSGTWRCLGYVFNAVNTETRNYLTLWQRIA